MRGGQSCVCLPDEVVMSTYQMTVTLGVLLALAATSTLAAGMSSASLPLQARDGQADSHSVTSATGPAEGEYVILSDEGVEQASVVVHKGAVKAVEETSLRKLYEWLDAYFSRRNHDLSTASLAHLRTQNFPASAPASSHSHTASVYPQPAASLGQAASFYPQKAAIQPVKRIHQQTHYPNSGAVQDPAARYPYNGYPQNANPQSTYPHSAYSQSVNPQSAYPQSGYSQNAQPQSAYTQSAYPQNYPQNGYSQTYAQTGYNKNGYAKNPYLMNAFSQNGYPQNSHQYSNYPYNAYYGMNPYTMAFNAYANGFANQKNPAALYNGYPAMLNGVHASNAYAPTAQTYPNVYPHTALKSQAGFPSLPPDSLAALVSPLSPDEQQTQSAQLEEQHDRVELEHAQNAAGQDTVGEELVDMQQVNLQEQFEMQQAKLQEEELKKEMVMEQAKLKQFEVQQAKLSEEADLQKKLLEVQRMHYAQQAQLKAVHEAQLRRVQAQKAVQKEAQKVEVGKKEEEVDEVVEDQEEVEGRYAAFEEAVGA